MIIEFSDFTIILTFNSSHARMQLDFFYLQYMIRATWLSLSLFFVLLSWAHGKGASCINGTSALPLRIESTLLLFKRSHLYLQQLGGGVSRSSEVRHAKSAHVPHLAPRGSQRSCASPWALDPN